MNPSRVTNADIDTDYSSDDRDRVKKFILKDHMDLPNIYTSEIITFNTIAMKGAIRDVGRAFGMNLSEVDDICKAVYLNKDKKWEIDDKNRKRYKDLFKYVDILDGVVVSIGTHPSGVLISDLNIEEEIGTCSISTSDYPISMLNMKELDSLMYVKMDVLGLDNVNLINETCRLAKIERLTPDNVDLDDEDVWKSIRDDTTLIFQWESDSAQAYLKKFMSDDTISIAKANNKNFSYIKWFSFGNGLIRPGCASFRDDVANGNVLKTGFEELDEFLSITSGRITMQEDIMQFLVRFCGYSDAESDSVRRSIAKKIGTEKFIDEIRDRFISYSNKKYNKSKELLEAIFPPIKQGILDATRYAFSWNHSDAYSCIGYVCGYLRYYYPIEFITASLNTFADKEDKTLAITNYAKKHGIKISPIKFRHSISKYTFNKSTNEIFKGISSIKFMNSVIADEIYNLRNNRYDTFIDLLYDLKDKTSINSRQLGILIELDFFSEFGDVNYLIAQNELFCLLYGKSQIKKSKLDSLNIEENDIRSFVGKETEKTFLNVDIKSLLCYVASNIKYKHRTLKETVRSQIEHLGYVDVKDDSYSKMAAVLDVDTQYAPKLKLYSLKNGTTVDCKIDKRTFNRAKLKKGDIVSISGQKYKPKLKRLDTGEYEPIQDTKELWITDYRIIENL